MLDLRTFCIMKCMFTIMLFESSALPESKQEHISRYFIKLRSDRCFAKHAETRHTNKVCIA